SLSRRASVFLRSVAGSKLHYFFFSSRRRHTRFSRDWSSDVCSSDLAGGSSPTSSRNSVPPSARSNQPLRAATAPVNDPFSWPNRWEERRVGKECRSRRSPYH